MRIRYAIECFAWLVTVLWLVRTRALMRRMDEVPDLSEVEWDLCPTRAPGLIVAVPARDEASEENAQTVRTALETLLAQDYEWLRVVAVDDRSEDGTGALLDEMAAAQAGRMDAVHLTEIPEGWLGKTFAMEVATQRSRSDYVLFTEADVWISPSMARRALAFAELAEADHVVVAPTRETKTWGERTILGFLQVVSLWVVRPWRVADPEAKWDVAASGAFSLVRREALEELGGFAPQRLAVADAVTLGRRVRAAGMRQRMAFAPGMVLPGGRPDPEKKEWRAFQVIRRLSREMFALVNFRIWLAAGMGLAGVVLFVVPLASLGWYPTIFPGVTALCCVAVCYRILGGLSGIPARYGWMYPLGAAAVAWAMLRSVAGTWWRRGVRWRGTVYPLRELRGHNSPFVWEFEAARMRAESRKAERVVRPSRMLKAWTGVKRKVGKRKAVGQ